MGDNPTPSSNSPGDSGSWRVRLRRPTGGVLGAGVLLSTDTVLTCAHVLGVPDRPVLVDLVGAPRSETVRARVDAESWVPERGEPRGLGPTGDLALLRLERPQPAGRATRLRRLSPSWDRRVGMYGFPEGLDQGIYLRGRLAGGTGGDGRVQIFPEEPTEVARRGFSGAGVTDQQTGQVIGIVVSTYVGQGLRLSFMIPTETVIHHLPEVERWTDGDSVVDRALVSTSEEPVEELAFATWLATWLRGGAEVAPADAVLVEPADRARTLTLRRALTQADRELSTTGRATTGPRPEPGTLPPVGSLDLAVDASRQIPVELAERVCRRMGLDGGQERLAATLLPLTVVVDGVDRAPDPAGLTELLELLAERGSRLLLVFHAAAPKTRRAAVAALRLRHRLGLLARRLDEIAPLEAGLHARHRQVRADIRRATQALTTVHALGRLVPRLREEGSDPDRTAARLDRLHEELDGYERECRDAKACIEEALTRLGALVDRREELRGRLGAARARARAASGEEDLALAHDYATAHELLWRAPCDVPAAERAVAAYVRAVIGHPDEPTAGVSAT
ncbi:serine protease [Streptomyces sp. 8K308]|uniref:S1 family peptidase n=1 Tax=Streptomyces sp. 8K308 TaxID=2530388 RepID=UPI002443410C|nr:serine protease [Streptomyces sp. 8K308]